MSEEAPKKLFRFQCHCPDCATPFYLFGQTEEMPNVKVANWGYEPSVQIICPSCGHIEEFKKP